MDARPIHLFVVAPEPVVQGVVRLAADAADGIGNVSVVSADELADVLPAKRPSIVVLDLDPEGSRLALIPALLEVAEDTRVVVLSERDDGSFVFEALRLGIAAFLRKPEGLRGLSDVISRVAAGERVVPPELDSSAASELRRFARRAQAASSIEAPITARERQILELAAEGFTTHQIGRRLGISPRTVEAHIAKLYRKLGVKTRIQAVARAAALGLIDIDGSG